MQTKTKGTFARFYGLLAQMPGVDKDDLVWQYSGLLTTSLRELYDKKPSDYMKMIRDMQATVNAQQSNSARHKDSDVSAYKSELKRYRSAVLYRLQKHGIDTTNWDRVNTFMRQPRIAGKTLGEMSIDELKAFIPKMESILSKDLTIRAKIERMQQMN